MTRVSTWAKQQLRCMCHVILLWFQPAHPCSSRVEVVPFQIETRYVRCCRYGQIISVSRVLRSESSVLDYGKTSHETIVACGVVSRSCNGTDAMLFTMTSPDRKPEWSKANQCCFSVHKTCRCAQDMSLCSRRCCMGTCWRKIAHI